MKLGRDWSDGENVIYPSTFVVKGDHPIYHYSEVGNTDTNTYQVYWIIGSVYNLKAHTFWPKLVFN